MSPAMAANPPAKFSVRRVAVVGAECVGKTSLCQALAQSLPGLWVPEYLREFCDRAQRTPLAHEQRDILQMQIELESRRQRQAAELGLAWLCCDSAPIATALYSLMLFGYADLIEPALQHHRHYQATLLLEPDLPWIADGIQRDGPGVREQFHRLLTQYLQEQGIPFHRVSGRDQDRVALAIRALDLT